MEQVDLGKSSTGIDPKVAALLSYLAGIISGIVFYVIEKENKFVRFHAMQSIIVFGALLALHIVNIAVLGMFLPWGLRGLVSAIINLGGLALWIILMIKAYQGEYFKLPIAGDIAEKKA